MKSTISFDKRSSVVRFVRIDASSNELLIVLFSLTRVDER